MTRKAQPVATCVGLVLLALTAADLAPARAQERAPRAAGSDARPQDPDRPALRAEYDALLAEMASSRGADERRVQELDKRVGDLFSRLRVVDVPRAGKLARTWAQRIAGADLEAALRHLDAAIGMVRETGDLAQLVDSLGDRGRALFQWGRLADALPAFEEAMSICEERGDEINLARLAFNVGVVRFASGRRDEALAAFDRAASIFEARGDRSSMAAVSLHRGNAYASLSRFDEALGAFDAAADVFDRLGDEVSLANVSMSRGTALEALGRHDDALRAYEHAAAVFEQVGDAVNLASATMGRANVLEALGRREEALEAYRRAALVFERRGDPRHLAMLAGNRGTLCLKLGRYVDALCDLELALGLFEQIGDEGNIAVTAVNRAACFQVLGRYEDALAELDRAAGVFAAVGDEGRLAAVATGRGAVCTLLGRHEDALAEFDRATRYYENVGDQASLARVAMGRGGVFLQEHRHADALRAYDEAAGYFGSVGDDAVLATIWMNRGSILALEDDPDAARSAFDTATVLAERGGRDGSLADIARNRGALDAGMGRHAQALERFVECAARVQGVLALQLQEVGQETSEAWRPRFQDLARLAMVSCRELIESQPESLSAAYVVLQTLHGLGTSEMLAERHALGAASMPEDLRRQHDQAYAALLKSIAERDALLGSESPEPAARATAIAQVHDCERKLADVVERARLRSRAYVDVSYPAAASLEEVRAELGPGTALVEYVLGDDEAFAVVTTRHRAALVTLGSSQDIETRAGSLAQVLGARDLEPTARELRELGRLVLGPVLDDITAEDVKTLLISPHGALCRIPFEVLLVSDLAPGTARSRWPYLIAGLDVGYVHSGTVLVALRRDARERSRREDGLEFVGLGHPYDAEAEGQAGDAADPAIGVLEAERGTRKPLPGSAREVLSIAGQFAEGAEEARDLERAASRFDREPLSREPTIVEGARFRVLLRDRADELALKSDAAIKSARIVHLACHGEADLTSPRLSRLVLSRAASVAGATQEDGYVYVGDLRDLGLSCELLVLSACESTAGKLSALEGMTGLSRAALAGGAQSVMSTLWRVGDASAGALMASFYERLHGPEATRITALAAAKRTAIQTGMPIGAWSAYVLWDAWTER